MTNQHSRMPLDPEEIRRRYLDGQAMDRIAADLGVNKRRVRRALLERRFTPRASTDHLTGNSHALRTDLSREELVRMYVEDGMSIRAIERATGYGNVRHHLLKHSIPLRRPSEHRIGKGDALSPESRVKAATAIVGPNNGNWKGGITNAFRKFYASPLWRRLARRSKECSAPGF